MILIVRVITNYGEYILSVVAYGNLTIHAHRKSNLQLPSRESEKSLAPSLVN